MTSQCVDVIAMARAPELQEKRAAHRDPREELEVASGPGQEHTDGQVRSSVGEHRHRLRPGVRRRTESSRRLSTLCQAQLYRV